MKLYTGTTDYSYRFYRGTAAPQESIGKRLRAYRAAALAKGMKLLTVDEINRQRRA